MRRRRTLLTAFVAAGLCILMLGAYGILTAEEYDPETFEVLLHRTDLYTGESDTTPETVFDGGGVGTVVDIVTSPGDVFGEGVVVEGVYRRMALALGNLVSVAGSDPCDETGMSSFAGTFLINESLPADAQVQVYFATAEDGGNSMVTAEGTSASPFLMQNPVIVEDGETTVVRLAFYTSGSLVCVGGTDVNLRPPTLTVASYIEGVEPVVDLAGDYWFAHFNVNTNLYDEQTGDWFDPSASVSPDEVLSRTGASTGWGSLHLFAPDTASGIGTWRIENASWRDEGFGEHRHSFDQWDPADEGYDETAPNLPMEGTYLVTGNHILVKMGGSTAMEGYVADDGSSFILVNIGGVDDSDVMFAVKKATDFPSDITSGTYVIVSPQIGFRYNTVGLAPPYPATGADFNGEMIVIDGTEDRFFSWGLSMALDYGTDGSVINTVYGREPEERAQEQDGLSAMLAFDISGFATSSPDDNTMFLAMVGDDTLGCLGVFAGLGTETGIDDDEHRLTNGFIVEADTTPTLAELAGVWALMGINWEGQEGSGGWNTGDEEYEMMVNYGYLDIDDTGSINWSFTNKDIITQDIEDDTGSGSVAVATEYYKIGNPIDNPDVDAIPLPLFTINSPSGSSTVVARAVMDRRGNTLVFWSPMDEGGIPVDSSTTDTANSFVMGAAVRIR